MVAEGPRKRCAVSCLPYPRPVPEKDIKKSLLQTLIESQDRERQLVKLCDDVRSEDPAEWTPKDHLVHLAHWRRYAAQVLTAVRTGGTPPVGDDVEAVNAGVQAANRDRRAAEVKEAASGSYMELMSAIEQCSNEELLAPRPGREQDKAWEVVPGNGHLHLGEHLGFWYEAQGDDRNAEKAQLWASDVNDAAFTDPKSRAFGAYNLGCYYARHGRAGEALPHLKSSFNLYPDLKEWARKDKDLDRIREESELRAILA
jgi:tetratricopeptide (TPR) repeat protein